MKKALRLSIKILLCCLAFRAVERFCHKKTEGFKVSNVLSHLDYDPKREVVQIEKAEMQELEKILEQPFTFLGSGGQAYAFLSADGKTVLKLFKHHHLTSFSFLNHLPLPARISRFVKEREGKRERFFQSCKLSFEEMRKETGLLYMQLNKSSHWKREITLIDKLGIAHKVELDRLEFALQKRASLALNGLKRLVKAGKREEAKEIISSMLSLIATRCHKGIKDNDTGLRRNMGLLENEAIAIDIGSFSKEPALTLKPNLEKELREKTRRLALLLRKSDPELASYYEDTLQELSSN